MSAHILRHVGSKHEADGARLLTRVRQPRGLEDKHGRVLLGSKRKPATTRPCVLKEKRGKWRSGAVDDLGVALPVATDVWRWRRAVRLATVK
jgi:hypothetical protein